MVGLFGDFGVGVEWGEGGVVFGGIRVVFFGEV